MAGAEVPILRGEGIVVVRRGRTILDVDSIEVSRGEVLAILGPNGAGKTTLLSVLGTVIEPDRGRLFFQGRELVGPVRSEFRRRTGFVFQDPLLFDGTVLFNAKLGLFFRDIKGEEADRRALFWLNRLGVSNLKNAGVWGLSGGEARRVSIARALAFEPDILLLDEPFASLDMFARERLMTDLRETFKENGLTVLLVSHDLRDIQSLADRLIVVQSGKIMFSCAPNDITPADVIRIIS